MGQLYKINQSGHAELFAETVDKAESFFARAKGLLGRSAMAPSQALWIAPCNNIHTFFMKFSIDCIFVDRNLFVVKVKTHIRPFKIVGPFWNAHSVFEVAAGQAELFKVKEGDQLYVVN